MEQLIKTVLENVENYIPHMPFRDGQKVIFNSMLQPLYNSETSCYIEGPTGIGKTFLEATLADAMLGQYITQVLILVPTLPLMYQISDRFTEFAPHRSLSLYGDGKKDMSGEVVIMTYQSYRTLSSSQRAQFLVVLPDEGHKALGLKTRSCIKQHMKTAIMMGLTATSKYSKEKGLRQLLGTCAYHLSLRNAIRSGMLCNFQLVMAHINVSIPEKDKGESTSTYEGRVSTVLIRQGGNEAAVRLFSSYFEKRKIRGIMFVLDTKQGEDLLGKFEDTDVRARFVTAETKDREQMFKDFRNGEFDILIGIRVIMEGFDDPGVSFVMMVYPTNSLVNLKQGPGRGGRLDPNNPKKICYIIMPHFNNVKKQLYYHDILGDLIVTQEGQDKDDLDFITEEEIMEVNKCSVSTSTNSDSYDGTPNVYVSKSDYETILIQSRGYVSKEEAPEGWMTVGQIAQCDDVQGDTKTIKSLAEIHRSENPGWFKGYWAGNNMFTEHYHPNLVSILKEKQARKELAPNGWMTAGQIAQCDDVQGKSEKIKSLAEIHRSVNPEWFKMYLVHTMFIEHYHPNLVTLLKESCTRKEQAPEGWMTAGQIAQCDDVQGDTKTIKSLAEVYHPENPEWFKMYLVHTIFTEHYHPNLVSILKEKQARKELAPNGWMTAGQIAQCDDVQGGDRKIKSLAEIHRSENPEWFKMYSTGNIFTEHYHPELVSILKEKQARKELAPNGWMTASQIAQCDDVQGNTKTIKSLAEVYHPENPEWFKIYWAHTMFTEHYHPELVSILKEKCKRKFITIKH